MIFQNEENLSVAKVDSQHDAAKEKQGQWPPSTFEETLTKLGYLSHKELN